MKKVYVVKLSDLRHHYVFIEARDSKNAKKVARRLYGRTSEVM